MFAAFAQAFRTPDLRSKLLFSLLIMALFRLGSFIPAPGVSTVNVQQCLANQGNTSLLDLANLFSGGALLQLSIFALGIMPYITASIIIQLLRVAVPRFEDLHKEGQAGQAKLTQYTRYLTIFLGVLQSSGIVSLAFSNALFPGCGLPVVPHASPFTFITMVLVMTAGTGVIMWLGELITERGIGNGMSLLIFTSITATLPAQLYNIGISTGWGKVVAIVAIIIIITMAVVYVEQAQRRIAVHYAKRMVGRRVMGGSSTYIPLKINMSGVIPVIFSTSILAMPALFANFANPHGSWAQWIQANMRQTSWVYLLLDGLLILFFTFFYTSITFNPDEVADNMKRYGGFIPGIRAGRPTAEYLRYVITRITTAGAIYLLIVAILPAIAMIPLNLGQGRLPFGGTTLLIIVGVGLQTVKEINSQLQKHSYEGFLV
ncbi:preprotein translocase, SecY subunit [Gleimia coleocanis DSM 15436]|uniref:Protein translocase subunit SecY n=1 Tax=Gleimia coleocanis DSM 15436 TaxID=525245 RepID=C0VZ29_9ACTO|nr:preprotein translocase subunit SecY [Gleimia coleocanis]EEH64682.1 preprotein translocase, SecY subunit [Gleimia coleocanis DSM 15436]